MYATSHRCSSSLLHAKPSVSHVFARRSRTALPVLLPALSTQAKKQQRHRPGICRVLDQDGAVHVADATATNTSAGVQGSPTNDAFDGSRLGPFAGPVAVEVAPGAGLGLFTTEGVVPGQLLLISQPLATVALRPTAVASGPSKLIQTLLSELHNPGQRRWLQILCDRHVIAQDQRQLEGSVSEVSDPHLQGSGSYPDLRPLIDLAELQGSAAAGGQLDRLQMTPMQLADMVQECAYTLDPEESQITAQLLMAAGAADSSSSSSSFFNGDKACCGLWPEIALMGRSCAPNVSLTLLGEGLLLLRAADYMPAGAQLFISELQPQRQLLQPLDMRQQILTQGSGLICGCSRCKAEADLISQQPQLQQLLHNLHTTAAAAAVDMANATAAAAAASSSGTGLGFGSDGDDWDGPNPTPRGSRAGSPLMWGNQVLESGGGSARADVEGDKYQGDDWMWDGVQGGAQPDKGFNPRSSSSNGSGSSSNGSRSSSPVVIPAEYVPVDCDTSTAAAVGGGYCSSRDSWQQQQRDVALSWLQRLVADLLQLLSSSAPSPTASPEEITDQNLLISAACYSSWAAVRQALVILNSSSSSSSDGSSTGGRSSSSDEKLLATQLQYLLTRADLSPITYRDNHNGAGLSWQQLLIRVYDLEVTTLATVVPGSLDHVLVSTAAAAVATAATKASNIGQDRYDLSSAAVAGGVISSLNIGQDQYDPSAAAVAGGFSNALNHALAAKCGSNWDDSTHQKLLQACKAVAADACMMPLAVASAAAGTSVQPSSNSNGNGSSSSYPQQQQQQQQQQQDGKIAENSLTAAAADAEPDITIVTADVVVQDSTHTSSTLSEEAAAAAADTVNIAETSSSATDATSVVLNFMKGCTAKPRETQTDAADAAAPPVDVLDRSVAAAAAAEAAMQGSNSAAANDDHDDASSTAANAAITVEVEAEVDSGSSSSSSSDVDRFSSNSGSGDIVAGEAGDWWAATSAAAESAAAEHDTTAATQQVYVTDDGTEVIVELDASPLGQDSSSSSSSEAAQWQQQQQQQQQDVYHTTTNSSSSSSSEAEQQTWLQQQDLYDTTSSSSSSAQTAEDVVSGGEDDWWSAAAAARKSQPEQPRRSGWFPAAAAATAAAGQTDAAADAAAQPRRSGWFPAAAASEPSTAAAAAAAANADAAAQPRRSGWFPAATAAASEPGTAAAAQAPPPSWLSAAARADAHASSRSSSPVNSSSSSNGGRSSSSNGGRSSSSPAVNISSDGDDFLDETSEAMAVAAGQHAHIAQQPPQGQQQQHDANLSDVSPLVQPWQRGPPASWIKSAETSESFSSDLSGDDFDLLSPPPVVPGAPATSSGSWQQQQPNATEAGYSTGWHAGGSGNNDNSSSSSNNNIIIDVESTVVADTVPAYAEQLAAAKAAATEAAATEAAATEAAATEAATTTKDAATQTAAAAILDVAEAAAKPKKSRWAALADPHEASNVAADAVSDASSKPRKSKWASLAAELADVAVEELAQPPLQNSKWGSNAGPSDVSVDVAAAEAAAAKAAVAEAAVAEAAAAEAAAVEAAVAEGAVAEAVAAEAANFRNIDMAEDVDVADAAAVAAARLRYAAMAESAHQPSEAAAASEDSSLDVTMADPSEVTVVGVEVFADVADPADVAHLAEVAAEVAVEVEEVAAAADDLAVAAAALAVDADTIDVPPVVVELAEGVVAAADELASAADKEADAAADMAEAAAATTREFAPAVAVKAGIDESNLDAIVFKSSDLEKSIFAKANMKDVDAAAAAAAAILGGMEPLPAAAAAHLQQVLTWTVEVSGPLTASQQALVDQIVNGSSSINNNNGGNNGAALNAEQVHLLRQLLGLL